MTTGFLYGSTKSRMARRVSALVVASGFRVETLFGLMARTIPGPTGFLPQTRCNPGKLMTLRPRCDHEAGDDSQRFPTGVFPARHRAIDALDSRSGLR